jgi:aminopeptidase N
MLRGLIGDAAFWKGIRDYYQRFRDGNATTADVRRVMEQASAQDLGWFFDQWLTRGGFLKVKAGWSYDAAAKTLRLEVEQRQPGAPLRMPIEIAIAVKGETAPRIQRIEVKSAGSFSLPSIRTLSWLRSPPF